MGTRSWGLGVTLPSPQAGSLGRCTSFIDLIFSHREWATVGLIDFASKNHLGISCTHYSWPDFFFSSNVAVRWPSFKEIVATLGVVLVALGFKPLGLIDGFESGRPMR